MFKKVISALSSVPAAIISGVCLLASFLLPKFDISLPVDPAWGAVLISGIPLVYSAIRKLIRSRGLGRISSALLITIAMTAAILIGDLFAAGEVAFIMALGEILEDMTTDRAKRGLRDLIALSPRQGRVISGTQEHMVAAEEIRKGDVVRILPGEAIPADGVIISGSTSIDQSVITGESLPVDKTVGDDVFCATINRFGSIDIEVSSVFEDSSMQRLIRTMREAESKKAPIQRVADKWASILVPAALVLALICGIFTRSIETAVTILVVFCPCALVLATPTAVMAAIGQAAKHGVVIKSGEALEKMGRINTMAFDKTGTLTHGTPEVSDVVCFNPDIDERELLCITASAESLSEHPLAKAVTAYAKNAGHELYTVSQFNMSAGKGITAIVNGLQIHCGNQAFLAEHGIELDTLAAEKLNLLSAQGKALIIVAVDSSPAGVIALCDVIREQSADVIKQLALRGVDTVLLTGDNTAAAEYFAARTGISAVHAQLLPEQKVSSIESIQTGGARVCMIGDGINDAPALKTADVGIAMGGMGSDITVEAADIALMSDDISKLPYLHRLSVAAIRTIKLSIFLSLFINLIAIILSATGMLNPTTGALVHNAGSFFVILIAALLYDRKFE